MDQLFNRWVDLDELDGVLARRIEGRVHEPRGWNDLFDLMDSVLAERLAAVRISAPGVLWAWWELRRSGGLTSIDSLADHLDWSHKQHRNHLRFTQPFDATGQPAMSVPTGIASDGLPTSMQIVGRPFDEATVLRVAACYEAMRGPLSPHPSKPACFPRTEN
jgi:hypothetical protein